MAEKWTDEQIKAIETTDKGVVVPAAAGSGKTAVLIERTVRLLEDKDKKLPAERLLAVTFTKDAANQMKTKLRAALADRIASETDPERRSWLARQREMLALAHISTISSFCLELVKENLGKFEYRSGIRIADSTQIVVLTDEAVRQALEEMRMESPERSDLLVDALVTNTDTDTDADLGKFVRELYDFKRSLPFPEEWAKAARRAFDDEEHIKELFEPIFDRYRQDTERALKLHDIVTEAASKMPNNATIMKRCANDLEIIESVKAAINSGDYRQLYTACTEVKFGTFSKPGVKGLDAEQAVALEQAFKAVQPVRESMKKLITAMANPFKELGSDAAAGMRDAGLIFEALNDASERLGKIMHARKLEQDIAEFGDIERMAMDLLVNNQDGRLVRTELAENIRKDKLHRVLLIDEFQDVNDLQETIFRALSDTDDLNILGKNVFVVGDVKQAIYRFRLSNPKLFLKAAENARNSSIDQLTEIRLTRNFRSRQCVLSFVNAVFRRIMSRELGELEYTADEQLYLGAKFSGEDKPCEIMLINDDAGMKDELKYVVFGVEELSIARRIKSLIDAGEQVSDGSGGLRPCTASDFCVLSRRSDSLRAMAEALSHVGLHAYCEETKGYMGSQEILTMVCLLRVIDNPMKDIPLASVMLSTIMGFSADELARLRLRCFDESRKYPKRLYQVLVGAAKTDSADIKESERIDIGDERLEEKCRTAVGLLERLRTYAVGMSLEELIAKIYDETGFFAAASAYENADQKRANLRLLTHRAAEYEKNSIGGIAGFLRFLDSLSAAKGDFAQAAKKTTGQQSVQLKTFHGSKGLEFPFVFLADLIKQFNQADLKERVLLSSEDGAAISYYRHDKLMKIPTIAHVVMKEKIKTELLSEEMRLLYVALTRAKERLFIPIYLKRNSMPQYDIPTRLSKLAAEIAVAGGAAPRILKSCNSMLEWIAAALMLIDSPLPLLENIGCAELAGELSDIAVTDDIPPLIEWREYPDDSGTAVSPSAFIRPAANEQTVKQLTDGYELVCGEPETLAASKRTVTEIVSEMHRRELGDENTDKLFYPQLGTLREEVLRLTAAQRGTFTHLFMELADYTNAERSVSDELKRLTDSGILSKREAEGVYVGALEKFFAGDFYKRMKSAEEPIMREKKFMVRASDAGLDECFAEFISPDGMLQGICDCIFRESDGYVLVDYKTDGFSDENELSRYDIQLELYKAALDIILPLPVKACYIYSFRLGKGVERIMG